ncbi:MAG: putative sugar nucleotidyl transferase [Gemmatimonadota bacterium]
MFDDTVADTWHPFALTRPIAELLYGALTLRGRIEKATGLQASATFTRAWLGGFSEQGAPAGRAREAVENLPVDETRLLVTSRAVVDAFPVAELEEGGARTLRLLGSVAGYILPAGTPNVDAEQLASLEPLSDSPNVALHGELLGGPWHLVGGLRGRLAADLELASQSTDSNCQVLDVEQRVGDGLVLAGPDVQIEPGVLFDTREGAVYLGQGTEVRTGSRLAGPMWVGADCRLLGGSMSGIAAGPCSYLRGEMEDSVILGYTNKAHDGFIGHSYLGRWVNLGALSTTSDLKNNYGEVRLAGPEGSVHTGLTKLGSLLGDHTKTAIGTMLGTGSVIGAGCNLFGDGRPPVWVPPFSWGFGPEAAVHERKKFLDTAEKVMARRGVKAGSLSWLGAAWDTARG